MTPLTPEQLRWQEQNAEALRRRASDIAVNAAGRVVGGLLHEIGEAMQMSEAAPVRNVLHAVNVASNGEAGRMVTGGVERLVQAIHNAKRSP